MPAGSMKAFNSNETVPSLAMEGSKMMGFLTVLRKPYASRDPSTSDWKATDGRFRPRPLSEICTPSPGFFGPEMFRLPKRTLSAVRLDIMPNMEETDMWDFSNC